MSLHSAPYIQPVSLVDPTGLQSEGVNKVAVYYWDTNSLSWVKATGGSIPGANVNVTNFPTSIQVSNFPATYSVTQGTSPWAISAASLPLPTNAAQETGGNLATIATWLPKKARDNELITIDWHAASAIGDIPGASAFTSNGSITTTGAATKQPVCSLGVVNYATGAGVQMSFVSSSVQDAAAGTGIRTMAVSHIKSDYSAQTEIVTLNGTTPVLSTVTDTLFINDMTVVTAGNADGYAAGNILASNAGTNYATILTGEVRQFSSFRMIPLGKTFVPSSIIASSISGTGGQSTMRIVFKTPTSNYFIPSNEIGLQDGTIAIPLIGGRPIVAGTIMGIRHTSTKAAVITGSIIGTLENA